ncbi:hybrid sensor histidine kinase/response regulator [Nitrogeniibacter mangrovi]|nr:response regulator [Nitrogeniibacter mangrovi]
MPRRLRLLIIEDNEDDALLLAHRFRHAGYELEVLRVDTPAGTETALRKQPWDLIISDHDLPGFSAIGALGILQNLDLDIPFIIVSGVIREETAIAAMRAGAHDYLSKSRLERLVPAVERELREVENRRERRRALDAQHQTEARLQAAAANTPGVIFQMQRRPGQPLEFLFASEATEMLLGMTPKQLCGDSSRFEAELLPEDKSSLMTELDQSARESDKLNWEGRIHTAAGDTKWINIRGSARTEADGTQVWEGVMWNITQSKRTEAELRASQLHLKALSNHLQNAKEEERERIARDVHDVLGGHLVGLKFSISLIASKPDLPAAQLKERIGQIEALIDEAIDTVGRITRELRPGILKDFGLAAAIESHAEDFAQHTGLTCRILCADDDVELPEDESIALFRIFQEALTNVSKHACAELVEVRLMHTGDGVMLEVADDGIGVSEADLGKPRSFGLRGVRERVASLGGTVTLQARQPKGTVLQVLLPASDMPVAPDQESVS